MSPLPTFLSNVTCAVLRYFVRNPQAADTLEGIARWRLLEEAVQRTTEETGEALAWLVAAGLLRCTEVPGCVPVYSLAAGRQDDAERLLSAGGSPDGNPGSAGSGR